ncbi:MAG TPA: DUF1549 and DUF1553 domain-containing protein [Gemmataceae bacterium]|jgi:hypothetical protein|nr:DUF1549 and DUF1553 domain-containing protein [Gemmataceae bacterium]
MSDFRSFLVVGAVLGLAGSSLLGRASEQPPNAQATKAILNLADAQKLARRIDQLILARATSEGVPVGERSDDAEFLRRVSLDLSGRIPRTLEARDFLTDTKPQKRQLLIDRLLDSPMYVKHWTNVWRAALLPQANVPEAQQFLPGFDRWLRDRLRENTPYDLMVQQIITAPLDNVGMRRRPQQMAAAYDEATPIAFYMANELKPENLASSASRLFLGIKLECAQCHDHPMDVWRRKQFWEFAAFFSGVQRTTPADNPVPGVKEDADLDKISIPGTNDTVMVHYLDGSAPKAKVNGSSRATLAAWITSSNNPYMAKALVNRLWAYFFGIGLVEPFDEMSEQNPASHADLLAELAREFQHHSYDLKFIMRAIALSETYQRASQRGRASASQEENRLFTNMTVRGLSGDQMLDSLVQATGLRDAGPAGMAPGLVDPRITGGLRGEFLARFTSQDKPAEYQTSILQALMLMNGRLMAETTDLERSETLSAIADSPFMDAHEKIEALYLTALCRKPRADELNKLVPYVESGGARKDPRVALSDVLWALLNSGEFLLNH